MTRKTLAFCCLWYATGAFCADWEKMATDCNSKSLVSEIAVCLKEGVDRLQEEERAEKNKKLELARAEATQPVKLVVRDTASALTTYDDQDIGDKGASLSVLRDRGQDSTQAKIAAFGVLQPHLDGRFHPFFGAAWARDGATRRDVRQLTFGTVGPLLQSSGPGYNALTVLHALQVSRRWDLYGITDGEVVRAQFDLAWGPLASGALLNGLAVLPHIAGLWQHRTDAGANAGRGNWRSAYIGVQAEKPFELGAQRFRISALARRLVDVSAPAGNAKRRLNYFSLSLDYYFYAPQDAAAKFKPSIFLTRETGTDFLEFGTATNRTTAGVRFKFN